MPCDAENNPPAPAVRRISAGRSSPDRFWFLTWTTYGTWLPGDDRGFVSNVDRGDGKGRRRRALGTEPASKMRGLEVMAKKNMSGSPVLLNLEHSTSLFEQFHETGDFRGWELIAVAIMANHVHIVVGVVGDPEPESILGSFKSYGGRRLNRLFGRREGGTWWTEGGSTRRLKDEGNIRAAICYVRDQVRPQVVWISDNWRWPASGGR